MRRLKYSLLKLQIIDQKRIRTEKINNSEPRTYWQSQPELRQVRQNLGRSGKTHLFQRVCLAFQLSVKLASLYTVFQQFCWSGKTASLPDLISCKWHLWVIITVSVIICKRSSHLAKHSFVEIWSWNGYTTILSLPQIQEGQLSVTGKRMCTKYW